MSPYSVVLTGPAKQDVRNGRDYYKGINHVLPKQFLERIKKAKVFLSKNPYANDFVYQPVRTYLLRPFPYHLHYYLDEEKRKVVVIAVAFAKRKNIDFSDRIQ